MGWKIGRERDPEEKNGVEGGKGGVMERDKEGRKRM